MVIITALVAIRYLVVPGFLPTHDGEYHLIRFYEFGRMLAEGNLIPRWAPGLNSGYGVPIFTFFYPLPNYIGSLFHILGWSLADSFRLTLATGYLFAVVSCYIWLKRIYGIFPAVSGSIVGAFVPYWFVDIFVRGSVGEVVALGFVFFSFACVAHRKNVLLAFAIGGLVLSHNIMAMIFLPMLALYAWSRDRSTVRGIFMGILLTSYFWVPALVERNFVVGLNTVNYKDHFPELAQLLIPSWGTGLSGSGFALDEMSYQIGIIPLFLLLVSPVLLWRKERIVLLFIGAAGVALFLMLELSIPVWEKLPLLSNLQYPWRLLSIGVVVTPLLAAAMLSRFRWSYIAIGISLSAVLVSYSYTKPVLYNARPDAYYLSRREFTDGTSSLGNGFSTVWMDWQQERPVKRMEITEGEGTVMMREERLTKFTGTLVATSGGTIRTHVAYYPGWKVKLDGKEFDAEPDEKGMVSTSIGPGEHSLSVYFSETPLRIMADGISFLCLLWLCGSIILKKHHENRH